VLRPIRLGDRGPAVEDVQRRLLVLGHELGPTGVDGVFLAATKDAVAEFQRTLDLDADGVVGERTWAALVDATFSLGDRLLYLRYPYLHGRDVRALQGTLNALGFACGAVDGIFGAFTERGVRDFQLSTGHPVDGIVGSETVRTLMNLRHVWEGKDTDSPDFSKVGPARAADVLAARVIHAGHTGPVGLDLADRFANLASAAQPDAVVRIVEVRDEGASVIDGAEEAETRDLLLAFGSFDPRELRKEGDPAVTVDSEHDEALPGRIATAVRASQRTDHRVIVDVSGLTAADEVARQRVAVAVMDGVCSALA
jgi:peptidoglycan hydrolase-like protein with peptidoglycan-binding domain